jgi:glycogen(starch) synthase
MSCDVLIVSNLYPPLQIGGYEIAARDVAEELRASGLDVSVLTSDYLVESLPVGEDRIFRALKLTGSWYGDYPVKNRLVHDRHNHDTTVQLIENLKPKVIYAWNQANLGAGPLIAASKRKIPVLHHIMGFDLLTEIYNRKAPLTLLKKTIRTCLLGRFRELRLTDGHIRHAIFLSKFLKSHYARHRVTPSLSRVVHPGIRVEDILSKGCYEIHGKMVEIVYLGQLAPHKGILEIKEAIHSLGGNPQVRLTLFGDGDKNYVDRIFDGARFPILYEGWIGRDIIYSRLHQFDLGIFSSTWDEPFGIAQIEMMAAGLPVISSGVGGSREAVLNNENGILFDSRNPGDLARKLRWFVTNYATHAARMGKRARETAQTEFSAARMSKKIRDVLNEIGY